jgi:hypothetical protein
MTIMLRSLLSLLVLVIVAALAQQECEIGEDGICIDNDDGCVDTHVKCDQWMSSGMYVCMYVCTVGKMAMMTGG